MNLPKRKITTHFVLISLDKIHIQGWAVWWNWATRLDSEEDNIMCTEDCADNYLICSNGKVIEMPMAEETKCYIETELSVLLLTIMIWLKQLKRLQKLPIPSVRWWILSTRHWVLRLLFQLLVGFVARPFELLSLIPVVLKNAKSAVYSSVRNVVSDIHVVWSAVILNEVSVFLHFARRNSLSLSIKCWMVSAVSWILFSILSVRLPMPFSRQYRCHP